MSFKALFATSALLTAQLVSGHAAITNAVGDAGGQGMALGIDTSTPRDGTRRNPFQQDATRFRGASAKSVGETVGAGSNSIESGTQAIMSEMGGTLPQVTPGGNVQMTLHQVNGDGAGPYTCMINSDGTGQSWQNIQVTQNVDGNQRGRNNAGSASDHPLTAAIPANQQCDGQVAGQDNVCLVRCQNPARAGPFGGVVPVQMAAGAGAGSGDGSGNGNGNGNGNGTAPNAAAGTNAGTNAGTSAGKTGSTGSTGSTGAAAGNAAGAGNAAKKAGNGGGRGNKNNNNNNNADDEEENENDKRSMEGGAFVKRIDEKTRAVEFTA
ncbi:CAS1 appressorium specific protein [Metarhizium acridum CQMa 102]|uniref:CAS1 appressorium specific protein n=1 Tax=Metarhizium acridum (strain CQMa 102) TaxID=655827 RepID=E9E6I7_METAQ|nr:CAS1 appressorium specific protein [Metarhizium acridum CQMa 102]EFY88433.1 CAS1 appressorium specific protein [Metarhizium acridum CQMa 102]